MKPTKLLLFYLSVSGFFFSLNAFAADQWLIASKNEAINTGHRISLEVVKPDAANWPATLKLKLSGNGISEEIELVADKAAPSNTARRLYAGTPHQKYIGIVRAELMGEPSNRLLLLAASDDLGPMQVDPEPGAIVAADAEKPRPILVIAKPGEEPGLSANDPMYFVVGPDRHNGADARFQLSFKYRPFDPESSIAEFAPFLSNLYFGYTQTTLWDLGEDSSPFRDTSYRPSLFYAWSGSGRKLMPDEWRIGVEHESNGQGGVDSRSLNTVFVRPTWHLDLSNGRRLSFLPKIYEYLEKDNNPDIQRYRGYADWQARYGREDGLIINGLYRQGTGGYLSGQLDFSYPLSDRIFARTGTFIHLQVFSGYGETLLDYNKQRDTQIRLGISLTR